MIQVRTIEDAKKLASLCAKSTYVNKNTYKKVEDIFCALVAGLEMGIPPLTALREFHNIQGKWEISGTLMLGLAINKGAIPEWEVTDAKRAVLLLRRHGVTHRHEFTMEDAHRAQLSGRQVWQQYPAAMLRARCASAAVRCFCPDAVLGGVYVHGETSGEGERELEMGKSMSDEMEEVIQRRQPTAPEAPAVELADTEKLSPGQEEELADIISAIEGAKDRTSLAQVGKRIGEASDMVQVSCEIAYSLKLGELAA